MANQQLIISGVGGQGILFVTRLLAETAIRKGLAVMTSETHGMAQRGGVVISHLKIGDFASPLVRPGCADGLLALKAENLPLHRHFLRPAGWVVVNAPRAPEWTGGALHSLDADRLALELGNPQALNLLLLGFAVARLAPAAALFCSLDELVTTIEHRLAAKGGLLAESLKAFRLGIERGAA